MAFTRSSIKTNNLSKNQPADYCLSQISIRNEYWHFMFAIMPGIGKDFASR